MTIVRFVVWLWSVGWLAYGISAYPYGDAIGFWLSACCFAAGVVVDGLLEKRAGAKKARQERLVDRRR